MTSHPNELTAWNVYANQLLMLGHGYPLWDPRPINCRPGVQIGDVGYISNGAFIRLFNAMASKDDALNAQRGVPNNHNPFTMGNRAAVMDVPDAIVAGTLCSKTIRQLGGKIEGQVLNSGASVAFECTDEQGAVLVLTDAAHRQQLPSRRMMNYLKQNIREWYTFATSDEVDLPLQKEDIVFVFGFVKTTQWAVASYVEGGRSARFSFNGGYGSAQASISAFATVGNSRAPAHNWGPKHQAGLPLPPQPGPSSRRRARSGRHNEPVAGPSADTQGSEADQCVFLQYYKMKYRLGLWPTVMRGAAGYDELPRGPDDPSTGGPAGTHDDVSMMDDEFVEQLPGHKTYDPADDILDYILKTPDATMAVATDSDIVRLCRKHNCDIPNDIPAFLDNVRPIVDINEDGFGILYFEDEAVPAVDPGELQKAEEPTTEPMRHEAQPEDDTPHAPGDDDFLDYPEEPESRKQDATAVLDHQAGGITALAYSNDGRLLASGSDDAFIEIWNVNTQQRIRTCEGHTQSISSLAFSPDGRELVSGSDDGLAIVWSTRTGERRFDLADHANDIYFVAYSPDGTIIATSSVDCTIRLWNARTGQRMAVLEGHGALVMLVSFSSDGRLLASASADFTACVWHVRTGQEVSKLRGHTGVVYSLAFAPDNRRLVTAAEDGTARIWKADTGEELVTLREHSGPVWAAVFSDDGKKVISGASDGTVKVCDSFGGELLLSLETGDMLVNAVAFSSDGSRVCASAEDNSIRVWSTMSGQQLTTLTGHEDKITHLKFSPDGKRIVSSSDDGMLRLWDLERMGVQPGIAV